MNVTSGEALPSKGRRIILVDPSVLGQSHLLVNSGVVELCAALFHEVDVVAEADHCRALVEYGAGSAGQVTFHPYDSKDDLSSKLLDGLDQTCPVVFLNLEYGFFFRVMTSRFGRARPVYWVLHSHFAARPTSLATRAKFLLRKTLLFTMFPRSRFIVYGTRIRRNLLDALGGSVGEARITAIIHPLGVEPLPGSDVTPEADPVRMSFVRGWHAPPPETEAVVSALAEMAETTPALEFTVVSNVVLQRADGSRVISSDYRERLDRLVDTDLVLYLPTNDYSLQASGALMDSFVSGRPLIGLQTDFQQEIESMVGPIGFFFGSREELVDFMSSFSDPGIRQEIERRRQNLVNGYDAMMEAAGRQLRAVLTDDGTTGSTAASS